MRSRYRTAQPLVCSGPIEDCRWLQPCVGRIGRQQAGGGVVLFLLVDLMKTLLLSLLLIAPAAAQTIYPNLAGARYCELRGLGVSHEEALSVAVRENLDPYSTPTRVTIDGQQYRTDTLDMAKWVVRCR